MSYSQRPWLKVPTQFKNIGNCCIRWTVSDDDWYLFTSPVADLVSQKRSINQTLFRKKFPASRRRGVRMLKFSIPTKRPSSLAIVLQQRSTQFMTNRLPNSYNCHVKLSTPTWRLLYPFSSLSVVPSDDCPPRSRRSSFLGFPFWRSAVQPDHTPLNLIT